MPNDDVVDDSAFNAGFEDDSPGLTETPKPDDAPKPEETQQPKAEVTPPAEEFAQIKKSDWESVIAKANALDELKADSTKKFDQAFGKIGSVNQLIERLQSATQAGQKIAISEDDFEELKAEGYPDLAAMTAAGLNRALSKAGIKGTGDETKSGIQPEQLEDLVGKRADILRGQLTQELSKSLKDEIRAEMAKEALSEAHEDWVDVVKSTEFQDWGKKAGIYEKKDRNGNTFVDSTVPSFVSKIIADYKTQQKQASTRKNRLEAAVAPKGSGGLAQSSSDEDEFTKGFNS